MKNLKRVLSLALSGIMLVGMMAVGAGAVNAEDFTDADEITHAEAVSISTALKIIDGKEDGSFDPNGNVTRGQMAKMITRAMFGGEDPVLGLPGTPSFTDIKGRWDEKYIEYCANNGIINGRGDGTFDPEGSVTGTEAAKMLLVALGYKADIYKLTGPDWALTTNSLANANDVALYTELRGVDPTTAFSRDQVAQMIYNALNANTRRMDPTMEITGNGEITYQYKDSGKTLLYDKYGAVRVEGVVTNNEFVDNSDNQKGKTQIAISNVDELKDMLSAVNPTANLEIASGKDMFQRAVIVYVKPANNNKKDLGKGTVISDLIYDGDTNTVVTTTADKKFTDWTKDQGLKFENFDGDNDGSKDEYAHFYTNYADVTNATASPANYGDVVAATGKTINTKNAIGTELIFIDNDGDGIVNAVLQNVWEFGQVSKYSTKDDGSVTVKTDGVKALVPTNEELKNIVAYEGIAVDDYVNCTKVDDTYYIEKAEAVTGDLDSYENDGETGLSKSATVDGETYKTTKTAVAYTGGDLKSMTDIAKRSVLTEEVTIYLDAFGYAVAGSTKAASDWLFVANAAVNNNATSKNGGTMTAFVYLDDGTSGSYVVNKYTPAGGAAKDKFEAGTDDEAIIGKLFQYSINNKGELVLEGADAATRTAAMEQTETTVADGTKGVIYDRDRSKLTVDTNGIGTADAANQNNPVKYVTMDTAVFFVTLKADGSIDKVSVYDEKTAPSMSYDTENGSDKLWTKGTPSKFNKGVTYVEKEKSTYDLDAVVFTSTSAVGSDWLFIIEYVKSIDGGRTYRAIVDGKLETIDTTDTVGYQRDANTAYSYSIESDGKYNLDDDPYNAKLVAVGEVSLADRKSVIVKDAGSGTEAKMTNSTIVALIDGDKTDVDARVTEGDVVYMIYNESHEAEAIFIIAEYDDTAADVIYTGAGVTYNSSTKEYTVSIGDASLSGSNKHVDLANLFVTSGKSKTALVKAAPTTTNDWDTETATAKLAADTDVAASGTLYLLVLPESEAGTSKAYEVYKINVVA